MAPATPQPRCPPLCPCGRPADIRTGDPPLYLCAKCYRLAVLLPIRR